MNSRLSIVAILLAVALMLTGCSVQGIGLNDTPPSPTPELAPSYGEIQQGIKQLLEESGYHDGPPVGEAAFADEELVRRHAAFVGPLHGRRVENWEGWFRSYDHIEPPGYIIDGLRIGILMEEPAPYENYDSDITLFIPNPTREQTQRVAAMTYGQSVVFGGLIGGITIWDSMSVEDGQIDAATTGSPGFGFRKGEMAPPYEEIQREIARITKIPEHPEGPEVGLDGIIDQEIVKAVIAYNTEIRGKKVEDWEGWYAGFTELEGRAEPLYNVAIRMKDPAQEGSDRGMVLLVEMTSRQIGPVKSLEDGTPVVFKGKILSVLFDGQVFVTEASIAAAR